jgi:putative hemolysin
VAAVPSLAHYAHTIAVTVVVVLITFLSLVLGELVPKRVGMAMPEPIAKAVALPMRLISLLTAPFIWLLTRSSNILLRIMGVKAQVGGGVTEEEIRAMVQEGAQGGAVQAIEQDIVERVFTLGDRRVSSLMTHRTDLVTMNAAMDRESVRAILHDTVHSVYPVVGDGTDDLRGMVSLKDLILHLDRPEFHLDRLLQDVQYLHENMPAFRALEEFKRSGRHHAIITDEVGATVGLLTLSDILLALVGDVSDFHKEEFTLVQRDDGSWLVDGQYPLHELLGRLGRAQLMRDVDVDTIGGLVIYQLGRVPRAGDHLTWMGMRIEVVDMDGARIDKVLVNPGE